MWPAPRPRSSQAVTRANAGRSSVLWRGRWTQRVEQHLRDIFDEPDLAAFPVATGTAANALALSC